MTRTPPQPSQKATPREYSDRILIKSARFKIHTQLIRIEKLDFPKIKSDRLLEEFITEHYLGFTKHPGGTIQYEVFHPQWEVSVTGDYQIKVDFGENYGDDFAFLNHEEPASVCYASGSDVSVSFPSRL